MLHRSTTYVDAACCYWLSSVVCQSVGSVALVSSAKTAEPIEMPFGWGLRWARGTMDQESRCPWEGQFWGGGKGHPIVKYRDTAVICAKTAEPIIMPFGLSAWMDPRDRVRWGPDPPLEGAVLGERDFCRELCRNGWTNWFAVWFVDTGGQKEAQGQSFSPDGAKVHKFNHIRQVVPLCHHGRAYWCHFANTIEPSICCSDAVLGLMSNYFDHLFVFL